MQLVCLSILTFLISFFRSNFDKDKKHIFEEQYTTIKLSLYLSLALNISSILSIFIDSNTSNLISIISFEFSILLSFSVFSFTISYLIK